MPNVFNQLLAGLSGAAQGYGQQQDRATADARQATQDSYLNEDRASQRALRDAQTKQSALKAQQDAYLRTPAFQSLYARARTGDDSAVASVASAVAGHPDAATFMTPLTRVPKPPTRHYDEQRGGMVDETANTFTPTPGATPIPKAPIMGSKEWLAARDAELGLEEKHRPKAAQLVPVYDPATGKTTYQEKVLGQDATKQPSGAASAGALASVADMDQRIGQLKEGFDYFSTGAGRGKVQPSWQTRNALAQRVAEASANNKTDLKGQLMGGAMGAVGYGPSENDPDFQKYSQIMQAAQFIGEETANAQKGRGNEAKVRRDIQYAMPTPADFQDPAKLADKLQRLANLTNLARATQPGTSTTAAGGRGAPPPAQTHQPVAPMSEDAWAAKNPPHAGESFDQYHARFLAAQGHP